MQTTPITLNPFRRIIGGKMTVFKRGSKFYIRPTRSQNITVSKWGQISIFVWLEARIMTASKQSHSSINDCYFTVNHSRPACLFRTSAHKIYWYPIIQLALKMIYWHQIIEITSFLLWLCELVLANIH